MQIAIDSDFCIASLAANVHVKVKWCGRPPVSSYFCADLNSSVLYLTLVETPRKKEIRHHQVKTSCSATYPITIQFSMLFTFMHQAYSLSLFFFFYLHFLLYENVDENISLRPRTAGFPFLGEQQDLLS